MLEEYGNWISGVDKGSLGLSVLRGGGSTKDPLFERSVGCPDDKDSDISAKALVMGKMEVGVVLWRYEFHLQRPKWSHFHC